jgi:hypothetical protein
VNLKPKKNQKKPEEQEIVLGLSDGIHAEVKSGLDENAKVLDNTTPTKS